MTSAFKQAISICGLTQHEAADFLDVRLDTIKNWCADRRAPPPGAWLELAKLHKQMHLAADAAIDLIQDQIAVHGSAPAEIDFSYSGEHGLWPSAGCAIAVEAMIRLRYSSFQ